MPLLVEEFFDLVLVGGHHRVPLQLQGGRGCVCMYECVCVCVKGRGYVWVRKRVRGGWVSVRNTVSGRAALPPTVLQYYSTVVLQYYSTTVLQYYSTTVLQYVP
jgi:hypothetical protein